LEDLPGRPAVRLGLRLIRGLKETSADRIMAARTGAPFDDPEDLARRADLPGRTHDRAMQMQRARHQRGD
jgi:error-prone DNA polymerase